MQRLLPIAFDVLFSKKEPTLSVGQREFFCTGARFKTHHRAQMEHGRILWLAIEELINLWL